MTAGCMERLDIRRLLDETNASSSEAIAAANALLEESPTVPCELQASLVCAGKEFSREIDDFPIHTSGSDTLHQQASCVDGRPAASRPLGGARVRTKQADGGDRLKRTVVLANVRESDHAEWRVRKDVDETHVSKVLKTLGLQLTASKTFRVGGMRNKDGSERTRPRSLFVEMESARAAKKVLHRKHLLGKVGEGDDTAKLREVYIDRPKGADGNMQANHLRKVRRRAMQLKDEMSTEELLECLARIPPSDFRLPDTLPTFCEEEHPFQELFLETHRPDVAVIVESWLKEEVPDSALVHKCRTPPIDATEAPRVAA